MVESLRCVRKSCSLSFPPSHFLSFSFSFYLSVSHLSCISIIPSGIMMMKLLPESRQTKIKRNSKREDNGEVMPEGSKIEETKKNG